MLSGIGTVFATDIVAVDETAVDVAGRATVIVAAVSIAVVSIVVVVVGDTQFCGVMDRRMVGVIGETNMQRAARWQ